MIHPFRRIAFSTQNDSKLFSEIFIGHTAVTKYDFTIPVHKMNLYNVDTGAAHEGRLTIMNVETKGYWQSDPVCELYPNEKGRNEHAFNEK